MRIINCMTLFLNILNKFIINNKSTGNVQNKSDMCTIYSSPLLKFTIVHLNDIIS